MSGNPVVAPVRHLNQVELALRWDLSPRTLERWRSLGKGPAYLKIVGRVVYRLNDVEAYERRQLRTQRPHTPHPVRKSKGKR